MEVHFLHCQGFISSDVEYKKKEREESLPCHWASSHSILRSKRNSSPLLAGVMQGRERQLLRQRFLATEILELLFLSERMTRTSTRCLNFAKLSLYPRRSD